MRAEILNKMIKYLMTRPYHEVYELMDEVRTEVNRLNKSEPSIEEVVDGD